MPTLQDLIAQGLGALKDGTENAVLPALAKATDLYPSHARLWQVVGLLHRNLEDLDSAVNALARAAALAPNNGTIAHGLARATMESGAPSLALFDRALALAPNDGELLVSRSAAMLAEGRLAAAIDEFDLILSNNPLWLQGHNALSQFRWLAGRAEDFTASFDRALKTHPQSVDLWLGKINLLVRAEDFHAASNAVTAAQALLGELPALTFNAAVCASETGDAARADRLFTAFAPFTDVIVASFYMRHLLRTGRAVDAAKLGEVLTDRPEADHIWPYLSIAWRLIGDPRWQWLEGDPRLVGCYDIGASLGSIEKLAASLRSRHTTQVEPLDQSVRKGTQTDGPLFALVDPPIRAARAAIVVAVQQHLTSLPDDPTHPYLRYKQAPVRFAGSWSVRLTAGGHHSNHVHPQGFQSSALYVVVPSEGVSGPAPAGHLALGQPPAELGIDLPPIRTIEPVPGRLVLFPSIMWHGTLPVAGGERMTVAFDVAKPRG